MEELKRAFSNCRKQPGVKQVYPMNGEPTPFKAGSFEANAVKTAWFLITHFCDEDNKISLTMAY